MADENANITSGVAPSQRSARRHGRWTSWPCEISLTLLDKITQTVLYHPHLIFSTGELDKARLAARYGCPERASLFCDEHRLRKTSDVVSGQLALDHFRSSRRATMSDPLDLIAKSRIRAWPSHLVTPMAERIARPPHRGRFSFAMKATILSELHGGRYEPENHHRCP